MTTLTTAAALARVLMESDPMETEGGWDGAPDIVRAGYLQMADAALAYLGGQEWPPLTMPADRTALIERAIAADDSQCSTGPTPDARAVGEIMAIAKGCHETLESWPEIESLIREQVTAALARLRGVTQ